MDQSVGYEEIDVRGLRNRLGGGAVWNRSRLAI
jgi:hypothetical protein